MRHVIIDGYNLLHSAPRYAAIAARDIDAARERLISDLGARTADEDLTVVFDGAGNPFSDGSPHAVGGLTVIFSPAGTDADGVIEALAAEARASGEDTEVVTSDGATRWTSIGGTVTVKRSPAFAVELADDERGWRDRVEAPRSRATLADRVDERTRDGLRRMRDGGQGGD